MRAAPLSRAGPYTRRAPQVAVLLNNAGVATLDGKAGTSWEGADAWRKVFDVNVFGVLNVQHTFVPVRAGAPFRPLRDLR